MNSRLLAGLKDTVIERMVVTLWRVIYGNRIVIGIAGFFLVVIGSLMPFVPIIDKTWRSGSTGLIVALSCLLGCLLLHRREFFATFFIAMFAAFFLVHEVIIIYDNYAIEMGKEYGPEGVYRLVVQIFANALTPTHGAFWGFIGSIMALFGVLIGWSGDVIEKNNAAAIAADDDDSSVSYIGDDDEENLEDSLE